jgi:hypothetical protein
MARLRAMDLTRTRRTVTLALSAALLALAFLAGPALAVEEQPAETTVEQTSEEGGRPQVAATPRDQLGLLLYAALAVFLIGGVRTVGRQLKGERPQASGEFRWR